MDFGEFRAHLRDDIVVIVVAENRRSSHERIRSGFRYLPDVVDFDPAVHFQVNLATGPLAILVDTPTGLS
jgi:hypothetical protein